LNVASERRERSLPLLVVDGLARSEGDAERAELSGATRLLRTGVDIRARGDLEIDESGRGDGECYLSFQESTGNSTGPERDIRLGILGDRLLDQDVADLQAPAGPENACHFAQRGVFVRHEVEDAIGDHYISPAVLDR